jgi:hypothetical protein
MVERLKIGSAIRYPDQAYSDGDLQHQHQKRA